MTLLKAYLQQASCLAIKKKLQGMPKGKKTKNKKQKKTKPRGSSGKAIPKLELKRHLMEIRRKDSNF